MSSEARPQRHPIKTLVPYRTPYTSGILAGLVLVVLANVFQAIGPVLIRHAIDAFAEPATAWAALRKYALLLVIVAFAGGAARFGMRQLLNGISRRVENDLRVAFFDH